MKLSSNTFSPLEWRNIINNECIKREQYITNITNKFTWNLKSKYKPTIKNQQSEIYIMKLGK